jgi:hypothetical protein
VRAVIRRDRGDGGARDDGDEPTRIEAEQPVDRNFDEATYLRAFPDIAEAVRRGLLASGLAHFQRTGRVELRLEKAEYRALIEAGEGPAAPQVAVDTLTISPSGSTLMTGWSDDRFDALTEISLETQAKTRHNWTAFPRLSRADVERTLETNRGETTRGETTRGEITAGHRFGFMLVAAPLGGLAASGPDAPAAGALAFRFASGVESQLRRDPVIASDADLRDLALAALQNAAAGEPDPEVIYSILDQHVGVQIAAINRLIIDRTQSERVTEQFGPSRGRYRGSIITMLRGGADQIVPRLVLACGGPGADEYESIVVVTNPEQFEPALRAARIAEASIGLSLTLVLQPGGDPAGTGEDAALDIARSDRLIFMDQAVLPRHLDWAARHSALLDDAPEEQTRLFGGMLYHPDGTLSQAGYYFARETSLRLKSGDPPRRISAVKLKAHQAPPAARVSPPARAVVGVPAAFMSVDRAWFEKLGGCTRHYSRALHEDIDLCLRSLKRGVPAWVHPLPMWHFDRLPPLRAEPSKGGAILNDWLLHRQWDGMIVPDLLGPIPSFLGRTTAHMGR